MSQSRKTVTINGTEYDKHTGLPLRQVTTDAESHRDDKSAHALHARTERSHRLRRHAAKATKTEAISVKPSSESAEPSESAVPVTHSSSSASTTPSPQTATTRITKFAPHPKKPAQNGRVISDFGPSTHPMVQRVNAARAATTPKPVTIKPSTVLKREAIDKALAPDTPADSQAHNRHRAKQKQPHAQSVRKRFATFAAAGATLALIAGYFAYINMPTLSVRIAAAQAGVDASYPAYRPAGYSLSGPIAYDNNSVSMKFAQNGGPQSFTLRQTESGWDSTAVLDNHVAPVAGSRYTTTRDSGLTIYTYDTHAAWVSGGILYTIDGDAPLSTEQVSRIATSL